MTYEDGAMSAQTSPTVGGPLSAADPRSSFYHRQMRPTDENRNNYSRRSLPRKPVPTAKHPYAQPVRAPLNDLGNQVKFDGSDRRVSGQSDSSSFSAGTNGQYTPESRDVETPEPHRLRVSSGFIPDTQTLPYRHEAHTSISLNVAQPQQAEVSVVEPVPSYGPQLDAASESGSYPLRRNSFESDGQESGVYPQLQYHHRPFEEGQPSSSQESVGLGKKGHRHSRSGDFGTTRSLHLPPEGPRSIISRPASVHALSEASARGRNLSPLLSPDAAAFSANASPRSYARASSTTRRSPDSRPISYIDLLNTPYAQQVAPAPLSLDNAQLRTVVGSNASLLDTRKTLEMYRANVKKTNDPAIQYEFAILMVQAAQEQPATDANGISPSPRSNGRRNSSQKDMINEARAILSRLADRAYPFAQYYLGDGYASGLFGDGKEDYGKAFPLFVSASKHGHAEAGYRAALCYEFGWGCRKDYAKAVQFYRQSATKNHPGAATRLGKACLTGDMGVGKRYREGIKWLNRAAEAADRQYNAAPYELGLLYREGYGEDIFKDEAYAAQLLTQSADLGHPEANLEMGRAYEYGTLSCPRDPALSVHFYNGAAQAGLPEAMLALCAWYLVGAEPVLEKDENEGYAWAKSAAELGFARAEYAVGYFTEMGIGCRRDPLEANVWYVRAADHGEPLAKERLATIRAVASGDTAPSGSPHNWSGKSEKEGKDCIVM